MKRTWQKRMKRRNLGGEVWKEVKEQGKLEPSSLFKLWVSTCVFLVIAARCSWSLKKQWASIFKPPSFRQWYPSSRALSHGPRAKNNTLKRDGGKIETFLECSASSSSVCFVVMNYNESGTTSRDRIQSWHNPHHSPARPDSTRAVLKPVEAKYRKVKQQK